MGLDIRAYRKVELIEVTDIDTWDEKSYPIDKEGGYGRDTHFVYGPNPHCFREQMEQSDLVIHGVYGYAETFHFRAGSYSGYNAWRDWLSRIMLDVPAQAVWKNKDKYRDKPFFYLINFSDCEGIIVGEAAKRLAQDFANHQVRTKHAPTPEGWIEREWWIEKYNDWSKAFELAADGGFVDFH